MQKTSSQTSSVQKPLLMQALAGQITPEVPFWFMRQAGRYLPEYRALRAKAGSFLDLCFNPDFASEVTLQPLRRFDMDAAILFSDILVVPYALGQSLSFVEGEGPRLGLFQPSDEVDFNSFDKKLRPVYQTVRQVKEKLDAEKALIGFAGAPWTVACYMVQGYGDGTFESAKKYAFANQKDFNQLIKTLVSATSHYLIRQIKEGADAVQLFDSWAGLVPVTHFWHWVIEPTRQIVANIRAVYPGFPVIGFPRGAGSYYQSYTEETGVSCIGIDQQFPLEKALRIKNPLQGNLDPAILLAGGTALETEARRILEAARNTPFIFNLGHGIIKETPPEHVAQLSEIIKGWRR